MRLSAPSFLIFLLSFLLGILAIIQGYDLGGMIPHYETYVGRYIPDVVTGFRLMTGAWLLLLLGNLFRGL